MTPKSEHQQPKIIHSSPHTLGLSSLLNSPSTLRRFILSQPPPLNRIAAVHQLYSHFSTSLLLFFFIDLRFSSYLYIFFYAFYLYVLRRFFLLRLCLVLSSSLFHSLFLSFSPILVLYLSLLIALLFSYILFLLFPGSYTFFFDFFVAFPYFNFPTYTFFFAYSLCFTPPLYYLIPSSSPIYYTLLFAFSSFSFLFTFSSLLFFFTFSFRVRTRFSFLPIPYTLLLPLLPYTFFFAYLFYFIFAFPFLLFFFILLLAFLLTFIFFTFQLAFIFSTFLLIFIFFSFPTRFFFFPFPFLAFLLYASTYFSTCFSFLLFVSLCFLLVLLPPLFPLACSSLISQLPDFPLARFFPHPLTFSLSVSKAHASSCSLMCRKEKNQKTGQGLSSLTRLVKSALQV